MREREVHTNADLVRPSRRSRFPAWAELPLERVEDHPGAAEPG
jgi:hypothetical protein